MIEDSSKLIKGQALIVDLKNLRDRFPKNLIEKIKKNPLGKLIGYKMVDGNQFALVIKFEDGSTCWFFEEELSIAS